MHDLDISVEDEQELVKRFDDLVIDCLELNIKPSIIERMLEESICWADAELRKEL